MGRDEHPASSSSSPGMDPHPPTPQDRGRDGAHLAKPSGRLHRARCCWFPEGFGVMRSPLSLSPLSQRLCSRSGAASSCTLQAGTAAPHGFSMLMASHCQPPPSLCLNAAGRAPGWRAGGQGQRVPVLPLPQPRHPLGQGTGRGQAEGSSSSPGDVPPSPPHVFHPSLKQLCRRTSNMLH